MPPWMSEAAITGPLEQQRGNLASPLARCVGERRTTFAEYPLPGRHGAGTVNALAGSSVRTDNLFCEETMTSPVLKT